MNDHTACAADDRRAGPLAAAGTSASDPQGLAALSQLLSNMSHELRTPLNAIIGYSEMLLDEARGAAAPGALESDLARIRDAGRGLLALIDDLLDIARIEAGRMQLTVEDFEITTLVYEVEARFGRDLGERRGRFKVTGGSSGGRVHGDIDKVRRILHNLLANAGKFVDDGDVVLEVRRVASPDGDRVEFSVSDSGAGIAPEMLDKLFEPFAQAEASAARRFGGTGLGLALSSRLARLMQGDIRVASEPGKGSTFTVSIPPELRAAGMAVA